MHMHAHDHGQSERNAYFLDQLCTIAVTGAYAGMVIAMFIGGSAAGGELSAVDVIAPWIQRLLLAAGGILLFLTIFRAVGVWRASRIPAEAFDPHHGHDHGHDHGHHHHDHHHAHDPAHDHGHGHDHGHDHGWSPLRYIPLVIPLVLYLGMGLPNGRMIASYLRNLGDRSSPKGPVSIAAAPSEAAVAVAAIAASHLSPIDLTGLQFALECNNLAAHTPINDIFEEQSDAQPEAAIDLGSLELIAADAGQRDHWRNLRRVEVEGVFIPMSSDGRFFRVERYRVNCCLNDARPAIMVAGMRKGANVTPQQWVAVQGRLDFVRREDKWLPIMRCYSVKPRTPPPNPWLN